MLLPFNTYIMYKVNDVVICLPGFTTEGCWVDSKTGGTGYKENKVFRIKEMSGHSGPSIVWPEEESGVYSQAVRKATISEIEKYVKDNKCGIEEILEICKNLYPVGTIIKSLISKDTTKTIKTIAIKSNTEIYDGTTYVYDDGKFAQIVSQQKEELLFKAGDTVICTPGFTDSENSGGKGYVEGKIIHIDHTTLCDNKLLIWSKKGYGIYARAVSYYKPQLKKEDFYNTKIDVSESPELNRLVQEKLFELGFMWCGGFNPHKVDTSHKTETILFIDGDNTFFRRKKSDLKSGYRDIYPQDLGININQTINNNNNVNKENNNSSISKIQGFNQQITSSSGTRGIGLTSSRSKITLGTVNKPNKVGLSTR